ncbi:hypothetical protein TRVL_02049 [Trypanosoma vivax]|nr:hypothetical protein TRVL_02049 [Trypanosoma vivax]
MAATMRLIRGLRGIIVPCGLRFVSVGGRRTRGGFSKPLGKHPQVKQGILEGVPRRIPGTTKVSYTNSKGRTFNFSVPVAEITHPQVRLTNATGSWREIDTSFCELGDMEDDMPSEVDAYLRAESDVCSVPDLREAFTSLCKEYVLMDTSGMKSTLSLTELNVGPDYEHYDRRLRRKRHWLAVRHRFEDVRHIIWPELGKGASSPCLNHALTARQMLDTLLWLDAASTFCVRKVHASDLAPEEEFMPLDLRREVEIVAHYVSREPGFFAPENNAVELFVSCAALCSNHGVAFSLFFRGQHVTESDALSHTNSIFLNMPTPCTTFGAIRVMAVLGSDPSQFRFSRSDGTVERGVVLLALSRLVGVEAFGNSDALENVGEAELCTILRFCVNVKEQNAAFFVRMKKANKTGSRVDHEGEEEEVSFVLKYEQLLHMAVSRCKHLLYQLDGPRTQVMSENGDIPLIDLQKHAECSNKDALIHYHLSMRSAQGLRRVALGAQTSAELVELIQRLEVGDPRVSGNTLLMDLVNHLSHKAAAGKVSISLREVNTVLPLLARIQSEAKGELGPRYDRLISILGTSIGAAVQGRYNNEDIVELIEGLAACQIVPSTFRQVEMTLYRLVMGHECSLSHVTRILRAFCALHGVEVSPVLLTSVASRVADSFGDRLGCHKHVKEEEDGECEVLVGLMQALSMCKYAALPSLVLLSWQSSLFNGNKMSLDSCRNYAALLACAADSTRAHNTLLSQQMGRESQRLCLYYVQNRGHDDISEFSQLVTTLGMVGCQRNEKDEVWAAALSDYIRRQSLTEARGSTMSVSELACTLKETLELCAVVNVQKPDVVTVIERVLLNRFKQAEAATSSNEACEELATSACCVVGLHHACEELRRAAADTLRRAILRAEEALEVSLEERRQRPQDRSFEVAALRATEVKNVHGNLILRYSAALQQGGMASYVEEAGF